MLAKMSRFTLILLEEYCLFSRTAPLLHSHLIRTAPLLHSHFSRTTPLLHSHFSKTTPLLHSHFNKFRAAPLKGVAARLAGKNFNSVNRLPLYHSLPL
jgi:hypothetical protein